MWWFRAKRPTDTLLVTVLLTLLGRRDKQGRLTEGHVADRKLGGISCEWRVGLTHSGCSATRYNCVPVSNNRSTYTSYRSSLTLYREQYCRVIMTRKSYLADFAPSTLQWGLTVYRLAKSGWKLESRLLCLSCSIVAYRNTHDAP